MMLPESLSADVEELVVLNGVGITTLPEPPGLNIIFALVLILDIVLVKILIPPRLDTPDGAVPCMSFLGML
jgi:hypothetical protein